MNKKLPCAKYIYSVETESIKFENYVLKNKQKAIINSPKKIPPYLVVAEYNCCVSIFLHQWILLDTNSVYFQKKYLNKRKTEFSLQKKKFRGCKKAKK